MNYTFLRLAKGEKMALIHEIEKTLKFNNIWNNNFYMKLNRNIRGQSISYFIYDDTDKPIYIAKFFDYLKDVSIPDSINVAECKNVDELVEKLAEADDFIGDIDMTSDLLYYYKRSFTRYVQVCREEDTGFPKIFAIDENLQHGQRFYGLLIEQAINGITLEEYMKTPDFIYSKDDYAIYFLWNMSLIIEKFVKYGIVHRDLSPDNIMVSNREFIVIDPGMVKIIGRNSTEIGYIMGKRSYASPEQYYGNAVNATFTSDLYSIGLIAFEIVTDINPLKYYIDKSSNKPHEDLLSKYDRELEDIFFANIDDSERNQLLFIIIHKMLQVENTHRFDDITSLQEAIKVLKGGGCND